MGYFDKPTPIQELVWNDKYRQPGETDIRASLTRVVNGVYAKDPSLEAREAAKAAVLAGDWVPAGRIHAGAGTDKRVTLINCYVSPTIQDSLATEYPTVGNPDNAMVRHLNRIYEETVGSKGIMEALNNAAYTMQMGGGIGMDFSTIRPKGALVKRTGSVSSGVLPFMDMWHSMCATIMSSGSRRGAMMGCLRIDHPDVLDFIKAKQAPGRLTNFNVSVLVTDAFMKGVEVGGDWNLVFPVEPADGSGVKTLTGSSWIYKTVKARELWDLLLQSTYEYAEPGVIFIDRVNATNNLNYCETIAATNPCGEQPLPPNGACNLGAVNLANMVKEPFTTKAGLDWRRLRQAVAVGVRFLDNVLDVTQYPTEAQRVEAMNKRRIGLGITGLGNMLQQLSLRYGSTESVVVTGQVMATIANEAYLASCLLAKERGTFPLYDTHKFNWSLVERLEANTSGEISKHGLRNGVLLTIAPTGTTSLYYGNVSSGLEPPFALEFTRKVLQPDGSHKQVQVRDWGFQKYMESHGWAGGYATNGDNFKAMRDDNLLDGAWRTALELSVDDHLAIQAACQKWVDASISKTINCPAEMGFEEFKGVYTKAYALGLKGCTTYRPSGVRGSVLSVEPAKPEPFKQLDESKGGNPTVKTDGTSLNSIEHPTGPAVSEDADINEESLARGAYDTETGKMDFGPTAPPTSPRPRVLKGTTYKIRWPRADHAHYVTINDREDGTPFEIFINSKSVLHAEWTAAVTRLISAIFRRGGDVHFLLEELAQVHATEGGVWENGVYIPSMVAMLGLVIQEHLLGGPDVLNEMKNEHKAILNVEAARQFNETMKGVPRTSGLMVPTSPLACPKCGQPTAFKQEGCLKCLSCGHSDCG